MVKYASYHAIHMHHTIHLTIYIFNLHHFHFYKVTNIMRNKNDL